MLIKSWSKTETVVPCIKCIPRKEMTEPVYTNGTKLLVEKFNEFFTSVGVRIANLSEKYRSRLLTDVYSDAPKRKQ